MAREYDPRLPRCRDYIPVYPPELERCNMAVDVALSSQAVTGPAKLLVPWVNNHGLFALSELRELDATQRALQTSDGRRLLSCFLDFGLQPAMLRTAQEGPKHHDTPPGVVTSTPQSLQLWPRGPKPERLRPPVEPKYRVQVERPLPPSARSTSTPRPPHQHRWLHSTRSSRCLRRPGCCLPSSQLPRQVPCVPTQAAAARR